MKKRKIIQYRSALANSSTLHTPVHSSVAHSSCCKRCYPHPIPILPPTPLGWQGQLPDSLLGHFKLAAAVKDEQWKPLWQAYIQVAWHVGKLTTADPFQFPNQQFTSKTDQSVALAVAWCEKRFKRQSYGMALLIL
ncbi:conserved hypothetical protein [Trichinella spiralis]|uniref:hypothetical protein n=1 Tax=Trichinella spiralis TaxID=6334 RepID=UPI0001EFE480|nr:conserved hypothetical protein [Trichinella spiralis]